MMNLEIVEVTKHVIRVENTYGLDASSIIKMVQAKLDNGTLVLNDDNAMFVDMYYNVEETPLAMGDEYNSFTVDMGVKE